MILKDNDSDKAFPFVMMEIMRSYEESMFKEGEDKDEVAEQMLCYHQSGVFVQKTLIELSFMESLHVSSPKQPPLKHPVDSNRASSCHPYEASRLASLFEKLGKFLTELF